MSIYHDLTKLNHDMHFVRKIDTYMGALLVGNVKGICFRNYKLNIYPSSSSANAFRGANNVILCY